ncbi:hypothetical protein D3C81_1651040 [compost metagenome]
MFEINTDSSSLSLESCCLCLLAVIWSRLPGHVRVIMMVMMVVVEMMNWMIRWIGMIRWVRMVRRRVMTAAVMIVAVWHRWSRVSRPFIVPMSHLFNLLSVLGSPYMLWLNDQIGCSSN